MSNHPKDGVQLTSFLRPDLVNMHAYSVPDSSGMIKLDAMENPYSLTNTLRSDWLEVLKHIDFNRYPDASAKEITKTLRDHLNLDEGFDLLFGNGSDEIILLLMLAMEKNRTILFPEPTFVMYRLLAQIVGLKSSGVTLKESFQLDLDAMLAAIAKENPCLIFISQPNNPTGNVFDRADLETIIRHTNGLVIIDEAYQAFTEHDALTWALHYPNVLILRTFSKIGLAGLRLGFLVGQNAIINELHKIRLPYNVNSLTQASLLFVLEHYDAFVKQTQQICMEREKLLVALRQIDSLTVWSSETNFLLFRPEKSANDIFQALKENHILIKKLDQAHPILSNCLRVTVGSPEENIAFLDALKKLV